MANLLFALLGMTTILLTAVSLTGRRKGVTYVHLLFAGPLVALHPEKYLQEWAARQVARIVVAWVVLFVLAAVAISIEG